MGKTLVDVAIEWNRERARKESDPVKKAEYEQNIANLREFKDRDNG